MGCLERTFYALNLGAFRTQIQAQAQPNAPNTNHRPTTARPNPTHRPPPPPAHLDHERGIKRVLEPLGELEWDEVAEVERLGGGAAPGVEVEALAGLEGVEELDEVAGGWWWWWVV